MVRVRERGKVRVKGRIKVGERKETIYKVGRIILSSRFRSMELKISFNVV